MNKSISVIIVAYNTNCYIESAIRSVLASKGIVLDLIVLDDGSSDGTFDIIKKISIEDSRIRCFRNNASQGPAAARLDALRYCQGDWVAILDSDDLIADNRLEYLIDLAESHGSDIVSDNLLLFWEAEQKAIDVFSICRIVDKYLIINPIEFIRKAIGVQFLFKASLLDKEFWERTIELPINRYIGDDFLLSLALMGNNSSLKICLTNSIGYFYRQHSNSLMAQASLERCEKFYLALKDSRQFPWIKDSPAFALAIDFRIAQAELDVLCRQFVLNLKQMKFISILFLTFMNPKILTELVVQLLQSKRVGREKQRHSILDYPVLYNLLKEK